MFELRNIIGFKPQQVLVVTGNGLILTRASGFVTSVQTLVNPVTPLTEQDTPAVVARERRRSAADRHGWFIRIRHARPQVARVEFLAVRTAAHALEVKSREAEALTIAVPLATRLRIHVMDSVRPLEDFDTVYAVLFFPQNRSAEDKYEFVQNMQN